MSAEVRDARFETVVGADPVVEQLCSGFGFTEGPVWHPKERHLIFSDIPGDHMRLWKPDGSLSTFRRPSNMANGNTYDREGRIVTCEHATSHVTRTEADGSITVLASHYDGLELNSPNDIVVHSSGDIYFTDPNFGRREYFGVPRPQELEFQGVYRIEEDGSLVLLADDFEQPNGLCFSRDETRLWVNDTARGHIRLFEVAEDRSVAGGSLWAEVTGEAEGVPDGMKVDREGNLFCTGPGGIHVFTPDADCLGVILVPEIVANFTWGGEDMRDLFITASTSLYRCRVATPGPTPF